jgi:hypothetical protein
MRHAFSLFPPFAALAKSLSHSELMGWMVGAVGIEIASLQNKTCMANGLAPPPAFNCCQMLSNASDSLRKRTDKNKNCSCRE